MVFDHLLVGAADLEAGQDALERLTGVRPATGGSHPRWGSHNALLALGPASYLELVALRPEAPAAGPFGPLRRLSGVAPVGWALATRDLPATRRRLTEGGLACAAIVAGARQRPDGTRLEWRMMQLAERPLIGVWPFFIEWGAGSRHPAADAPAGCRLESLRVRAPENAELAGLCRELELEVEVTAAAAAGLAVDLDTPAGRVTLGA